MRLIDADAFKEYMRKALEETRGCYPDKGEWAEAITEQFCKDIDDQPTIETQQTCEYWDSESKFCALCRPSAQPEQRYTEEELWVFAHGISLSLLSKRSAQRWCYDKDTATEIKFLERLYEKVGADMRGEKDE